MSVSSAVSFGSYFMVRKTSSLIRIKGATPIPVWSTPSFYTFFTSNVMTTRAPGVLSFPVGILMASRNVSL